MCGSLSHGNETVADIEYKNWYCPFAYWGYPVVLFGNAILSIGGMIRVGMPSKLAAQWFEPNEYDIATSLATSAGPFGTVITCLLAPIIAKEPDDLSYMQVYFAIPIFLAFLGSLFIRRDGYSRIVKEQCFKELVVASTRF